MTIVGALLLLAVHRNLGAIHVQHYPMRGIYGLRFGDQISIDRGQPGEISPWVSKSVSNDCSREVSAAPRSQIFSEPISRNVGSCESPLSIVDILIAGHPAVNGLAQQVR